MRQEVKQLFFSSPNLSASDETFQKQYIYWVKQYGSPG